MEIRDALPAEFDELGDVRVAAYVADGFLPPQSTYASTLKALGADGLGHVLVAVDGQRGRILGTVMLQDQAAAGETFASPHEAEIRALAVIPEARGVGLGKALLAAVIDRAVAADVARLVLLTQPGMKAAHHLYEKAGFARLPERDWSPEPGVNLLAYVMDL